ncbi:methionine ABC transporter ATP-binding protein [Merdimmobilis hominis]|jgi:D-methionine transport system ATP-binding protein|uniref:Methionine import ATP-binding protein MetN n=1 Tax=uncultured Anaerotruncus sp. TaxID=905011 RepID=A0A6N2R7F3_9FIRM|nr:methionine ABC transporter ATP-binding protein [Merdimmobilis hominis]MCD4836702.1 methionine ABC transporter ATP-binding protein [Merdimmobilis hominis]PWL57337.1 MAG: methionine ABC transporter ATP-binding protein [Oscillospiraceae bacterium]PWL59181.1 MAG: methionine ABC transporter ATP-binding protein [Oscillospiraceae bacterium]
MIQLSNISKRFETPGKVVEAVKHVTLSIDKGDIFGIMGFSGAGKSTLVRCINLLETPTEGTVTVDGVELTGLSEKELRQARKNIGMIFQHFNLMPSRTVFENIAYPLKGRPKEEIEKKITSLLELVGLSDKRDVFPSQLSGGQKQRVAIARALATDPQVLLCDEATSALDPQTTTAILKLLKQVNRELGVTIVIITHEMAVIKEICNRAAVMEHGEVIEQGDVYSLFATPQSPVTQGFINTSSLAQKVEELDREGSPVVALKPGEQILQLTYLGMGASQALISEVSRKFSINCNIVFGSIEIIQESPLGRLIIIASGREGDIAQAIAYLRQQKVEVEVLKQCQK